jgi:hypothetical protein
MTWDKAKPSASGGLVSADVRQNFAAIETAIGGVNLLADPTFLIWANTDALAPTHWTLAGASAAIARAGTGLGDTSRKVGKFTAKMTSGGAALSTLEQNILPAADYDDGFDGRFVSAGAWVRAVAASAVRIYIADGAGTAFSSFHTGGGAYEWLTVTRQINAAATKIAFGMECATGTKVGYLSGATAVLGEVPPSDYSPAPVKIDEWVMRSAGTLTVGITKEIIEVFRPGIVLDVHLLVRTAPTGANLIVDVNTYDGAANTTMFTVKPTIVAAALRGSARPDGSYPRRCFSFQSGATLTVGGLVSFDIDQIGSGVAGADLFVFVRYMTYARPLEAFLAYNSIN